jgi:hypothetical protein
MNFSLIRPATCGRKFEHSQIQGSRDEPAAVLRSASPGAARRCARARGRRIRDRQALRARPGAGSPLRRSDSRAARGSSTASSAREQHRPFATSCPRTPDLAAATTARCTPRRGDQVVDRGQRPRFGTSETARCSVASGGQGRRRAGRRECPPARSQRFSTLWCWRLRRNGRDRRCHRRTGSSR